MIGYKIAVDIIAITISIGGILFGLGYVLNDLNIKKFSYDLLIQSLINAVILGCLIGLLLPGGIVYSFIYSSTQSVSPNLNCGSLSNNYAICFAYKFLISPKYIMIENKYYPSLIDNSMGLLIPISTIYTIIGIISSLKFSIGVVSIALSSIFRPILSVENYIIQMLTLINISIYIQSIILKFVDFVSLSVLLPIGIVLRSLYFTRRLGGSIIALTLGLFLVFPMTYVLNASLIANYYNQVSSSSPIMSQASTLETSILSNLSDDKISYVSTIYSSITSFVSSLKNYINQILSYLALMIIEALFLPTLSIIITIISTRELARVLGTEISFGRFDIF